MTSEGFVTAVRGAVELARAGGGARVVQPAWFLVSRSGEGGSLLLVAWVGRGLTPAPMPRMTVAGRLISQTPQARQSRFALLDSAPAVVVAGRFVPAAGCAMLTGTPDRLFLRLRGTLSRGTFLRLEAERRPWFGEVL